MCEINLETGPKLKKVPPSHHDPDVHIPVHTIFTFKIFFKKNQNKPDSHRKRAFSIQNLLSTKNYIDDLKNHIVMKNDERPQREFDYTFKKSSRNVFQDSRE